MFLTSRISEANTVMNILSFVKIRVHKVNDVVREGTLGYSWLYFLLEPQLD